MTPTAWTATSASPSNRDSHIGCRALVSRSQPDAAFRQRGGTQIDPLVAGMARTAHRCSRRGAFRRIVVVLPDSRSNGRRARWPSAVAGPDADSVRPDFHGQAGGTGPSVYRVLAAVA